MESEDASSAPGATRKAKRVTLYTLLVYALLVATHLGEFWPFSIYPMFSQAGRTWVRSVVRDVSQDTIPNWTTVAFEELPGTPFPMGPTGTNQNDVANFVSKSDRWDERRVNAMRSLFGTHLDAADLMVYRVEGSMQPDRSVQVLYEPFILLTRDRTDFGPRIRETVGQ